MSSGSRGRFAILGLVVGLLVGVAAGIWAVRFWSVPPPPVSPPPTPAPVPSIVAPTPEPPSAETEAEPAEAEAVAVATGEPGPAPKPGSGRRASRSKPRTASPAGAPAVAEAPPPLGPSTRAFVPGVTQVGNLRPVEADLKGFDPSGVEVKRAPRTLGRIEFEVVPRDVRPGQSYSVKVFLRNDGKKPIKVQRLTVASEMNGRSSRSDVSSKLKEVPPDVVALVAELPGIWKDRVSSWSLEVEITAERGDTLENKLSWK